MTMPPTTTTVTLTPTESALSNGLNRNIGDTIPLGAIVGGIAGGVFLALVCLVGWTVWRRTTTHRRAKEKAASFTRQNTLRNSSAATSKLRSCSPPAWTPTATKVKFAMPEKEMEGIPTSADSPVGATMVKVKVEPEVISSLKKEENDSGGKPSMTPSRPKALKASKSSRRHQRANTASGHPPELGNVKIPIPPPPAVPPARIPRHKGSTISSGSYYSLESGEEYPSRPSRFYSVVSALGDTRSSMPPGSRNSVSSSMWSFLSRTSRGGRVPSNRLSQATSNSAYSQPEEPIVGAAY